MDAWGKNEKVAFGLRLHDARERKGLSQPDVAALFDITKQAVSAWEKGRNLPTVEQLARLAREFETSADWLVFGELRAKAFSDQLLERVAKLSQDERRKLENSVRAGLDMPVLSTGKESAA